MEISPMGTRPMYLKRTFLRTPWMKTQIAKPGGRCTVAAYIYPILRVLSEVPVQSLVNNRGSIPHILNYSLLGAMYSSNKIC